MNRAFRSALLLVALCAVSPVAAQQTVGVFVHEPEVDPGLNLFGVLGGTQILLVDNAGRVVNEWTSTWPSGNAVYLTDTGDLYRCGRYDPGTACCSAGGQGGRIERFSWDGTLEWDFIYSDGDKRHHHDMELLPNGNVLLIAWELRTQAEAIQAGRDPALLPDLELWPETIVEIEPVGATGGSVVWEWRVWDHLIQGFDPTKDNFGVVSDHPELIDINFVNGRSGDADWLHMNSIDYNAELDQIIVSNPFIDEFWIIDHSTTTAEAAGHTGGNAGKGGDLIYRWGNPQAYGRGTDANRQSFFQHDVGWIEPGLPGAGNILFFNNRNPSVNGEFSTITEIVPPVEPGGTYTLGVGAAYGPATSVFNYAANPPQDLFSGGLSSAQRLPNGNTLFDEGQTGTFTEVTPALETVWEYVNPVGIPGPITQGAAPAQNRAFRVTRYPFTFAGFDGKDLTPGEMLEIFTEPIEVAAGSLVAERLTLTGNAITVRYDVSPCASAEYNLLYGSLGNVSALTFDGSLCGIGTVGDFDWLGVPQGDLWYLVVGTDVSALYESSLGTTGGGLERNGLRASGECGVTNKVVYGACP